MACHPMCVCKCGQTGCGCHITYRSEKVLPPPKPEKG